MDNTTDDQPKYITTPQRVLTEAKTIAIVGYSHKPQRPSYQIGQFLRQQGYQVYAVNPILTLIDGHLCYPSISDIPVPIDIVNVFRRSEFLPPLVSELIALPPEKLSPMRCLWTQLNIQDLAAATLAQMAGWQVIMDVCIKIEYLQLAIQRTATDG